MLQHHRSSHSPIPRVVILGAGGFLSPVLRRNLAAHGANVIALSSADVDLTQASAAVQLAAHIQPGDAVVMAAGLTPDKGKNTATLLANLRMAEAVAQAIEKTRPAHFLYISSDAVYDARYSSLLSEDSTCEPSDLYALMHVSREKILGQACQQAGVPLAIVRPSAIYGPGDTHNSYGPNRFLRTALATAKISLFGLGLERRHHVFVEDVAELIRLCLACGSTGVINAVTGRAVTFGEVARMISRIVGSGVTVENLPAASAVTHRHFDTRALTLAFPAFKATELVNGLQLTYSALSSTSGLAALSNASPAVLKEEAVCPQP